MEMREILNSGNFGAVMRQFFMPKKSLAWWPMLNVVYPRTQFLYLMQREVVQKDPAVGVIVHEVDGRDGGL